MTTVLILAWLATGLGLGYGWSRDHIRANKAEQREGLLRADVKRLGTMLASAEADRDAYLRKIGEVVTAKAQLRIALDNERAEHRLHQRACASHCEAIERGVLIPTIEGNYLDTVANLPVGFRLDMGAFNSETPIGMSVVESLADVVPLRGGRA